MHRQTTIATVAGAIALFLTLAVADARAAGPASDSTPEKAKALTVDEVLALLMEGRSTELEANMRRLTAPEALPGLAAILQDDKKPEYARRRAASILGRIGSGDAREWLIEALGTTEQPSYDDGGSLYSRLVDALGRCIERESEKQLLDDLRHSQPDVRWLAASQLGKIKSAAAVPALVKMLSDPNSAPRLGATWALGEIGGPQAEQQLIAIVQCRRRIGSRVSAVEGLGKIATPAAIAAIRNMDPDDREYWKAKKTLEELRVSRPDLPGLNTPAAPSTRPALATQRKELFARMRKFIERELPDAQIVESDRLLIRHKIRLERSPGKHMVDGQERTFYHPVPDNGGLILEIWLTGSPSWDRDLPVTRRRDGYTSSTIELRLKGSVRCLWLDMQLSDQAPPKQFLNRLHEWLEGEGFEGPAIAPLAEPATRPAAP